MRIANWPDKAYSEKVIRPPGAVEERDFLNRCIRCAECMKVCPITRCTPHFFEAGIEGMWTPILIPRIGYCEYSCGVVRPSLSDWSYSKGSPKRRNWGLAKANFNWHAMYDQGRCLPWAMATLVSCVKSSVRTSPKAIWVEEVTVPKRDDRYQGKGEQAAMTTVKLQRPHVDPSLCIGCGAARRLGPLWTNQPYTSRARGVAFKDERYLAREQNYSQKS